MHRFNRGWGSTTREKKWFCGDVSATYGSCLLLLWLGRNTYVFSLFTLRKVDRVKLPNTSQPPTCRGALVYDDVIGRNIFGLGEQQFMTDFHHIVKSFCQFVLCLHPLALSLCVSSCVSYHRVKPIIAKNHVKFPFHSLPATVVRRHRIVDIFPTVSCLEHILGET
jgi:hypothetical protein